MKAPKGKADGFEDGLSSDEDDDGDALLKSGLFKVKETPNPSKEVEAEVLSKRKRLTITLHDFFFFSPCVNFINKALSLILTIGTGSSKWVNIRI